MPVAFTLPPLPYAYDALVPFMSKETLEFHHDKHHNAYVVAGNTLAGDGTKYAGKSIEDICKEAFAGKDQPVINQIGQHYNHIHFWSWMKKGGGGKKLPGALQATAHQQTAERRPRLAGHAVQIALRQAELLRDRPGIQVRIRQLPFDDIRDAREVMANRGPLLR